MGSEGRALQDQVNGFAGRVEVIEGGHRKGMLDAVGPPATAAAESGPDKSVRRRAACARASDRLARYHVAAEFALAQRPKTMPIPDVPLY